jgi:hypothetical protein
MNYVYVMLLTHPFFIGDAFKQTAKSLIEHHIGTHEHKRRIDQEQTSSFQSDVDDLCVRDAFGTSIAS